MLAGAVNTPVEESMDPQLGLQVVPLGLAVPQTPPLVKEGKSLQMVADDAAVDETTGCMTFQLRLSGALFANVAVNWICCAGDNPTGAVAVKGVTEMRIPVSSVIAEVPVFFVSASAAAVNVITGIGLGKFCKEGAV
jgi:hypothetical protein